MSESGSVSPAKTFCSKCGHGNPAEAKTCENCNKKIGRAGRPVGSKDSYKRLRSASSSVNSSKCPSRNGITGDRNVNQDLVSAARLLQKELSRHASNPSSRNVSRQHSRSSSQAPSRTSCASSRGKKTRDAGVEIDVTYPEKLSPDVSEHESDREFLDDDEGSAFGDVSFQEYNEVMETIRKGSKSKSRRSDADKENANPQKKAKRMLNTNGEAFEKEDDEENSKARKLHRTLRPIAQVGLGCGDGLNQLGHFFKCIRKPWIYRSYESNGIVEHQCVAWLRDATEQYNFAKHFFVPLVEDHGCRQLPSDKWTVQVEKNWTAKALHTAVSTGPRTLMERLKSRKVTNVWVSQFTSDRIGDKALDGGPDGGFQGLAEMVFWRFSRDDVHIFSQELLNLVTHICGGGHRESDVNNLWPAIATAWTAPAISGKKSVIGSRVVAQHNLTQLQSQSNLLLASDVDMTLLQRIVANRVQQHGIRVDDDGSPSSDYGFNDPTIIPSFRQTGNIDIPITGKSDVPLNTKPDNVSGLFDVYLFQDIVHGFDSSRRPTAFKIDMVKIQAKYPAMDPLLAVHQIATTDQRLAAEVMATMRHMCDVLDFKFEGTLAEAFQTGTAPICQVCCEAMLPWAVMKYAARQHIQGVHFGGFRADVNDHKESVLWQNYANVLYESRKSHYNIIADEASLEMREKRTANKPVENFHLDYYEGQYYRRIPRENIDNAYSNFVANLEEDPDRQSMIDVLQGNLNQLEHDDQFYYVCDGRPWARNTGVWMRVDADAFRAYEKKESKQSKEDVGLIQPGKISAMIELYLANCSIDQDPLRILEFSDHVPDYYYLSQNRHKLPEPLMRFVDTMQNLWDHSHASEISEAEIRWDEITQLYGMRTHPIRHVITATEKESPLEEMAEMLHSSILHNIKSTLTCMRYGELKQWSFAAKSIADLEQQGRLEGHKWVKDNQQYNTLFSKNMVQETKKHAVFFSDTTKSGIRQAIMESNLDLKLSFSNMILKQLLEYNTAAHFSFQRKQYGSCIKIADMAHCVQVVTKTQYGHKLVIVDFKYPGAGADSLVNLMCEMHRAFGAFSTLDAEIRKFYAGDMSKDIVAKHISPFSMATYLGSGLAVFKGKEIDPASNHENDCGLLGFLTEVGKLSAQSATTQDQVTNIECFINESGQGAGTKKQPWTTTRGLAPVRVDQAIGFPVGVICANRPQHNTTLSIFVSGRIMVVASATRDDNVGMITVNKTNSRHPALSSPSSQKNNTLDMLDTMETEHRPKIRPITGDLANQQLQFFLTRHMLRRCVPFISRTMTLDVKKSYYTFRTSCQALNTGVQALTNGMRRQYLSANNHLSRTADGPWESCLAYGTHVSVLCDQAILRAINAKYKTITDCTMVPMENVMPDIVHGLLSVPMCTTTLLSSLHLWLFSTVLDCSLFALVGSLLYGMGFQSHCPLSVIAMACRDIEMTERQEEQYSSLCLNLLPLIASDVPATFSKDGLTARNITEGKLHLPTLQDTLTMINHKAEDAQEKITTISNKHAYSTQSLYVAPSLKIVQHEAPEWFQRKQNAPWNKGPTRDDYQSGSPAQIAAFVYAQGQKKKAHLERVVNGHKPKPWEIPHLYWEAAHEGMRLPKCEGHDNDSNGIEFEPAWETGHWYNDTMKNVGSCSGIVNFFLTLCGCDKTTTYEDFFSIFLSKFCTKHGIDVKNLKIYNARNWKKPIVEDTEPIFKWAFQATQNGLGVYNGVESTLCINLLHLIIMQALCTQEWKTTSSISYEAVTHLRVVAQANLELMFLLLHVSVDKAAVPANDGQVMLLAPSPFKNYCHKNAMVTFDPRLHIDSCMVNGVNNTLSIRSRQANNFKLWTCFDKSVSLYYTKLSQSTEVQIMDKISLYFPFPPEGIYHMTPHYELMHVVLRRFSSDNDLNAIQHMRSLLPSMTQYGHSVTTECVRHLPCNLTFVTSQEDFEIPCVTYKQAMPLVLVRQHGYFALRPVKTNLHCSETLVMEDEDTEYEIPGNRIADVMYMGLTRLENGSFDVKLQAPANEQERLQRYPFYPFPCIMWPQLVEVSMGNTMLQMTNSVVELVNIEQLMQELSDNGKLWSSAKDIVESYLQQKEIELPDDYEYAISDSGTKSSLLHDIDNPNTDLLCAHIFAINRANQVTVFNGIEMFVNAINNKQIFVPTRSPEYMNFVVRKPGTTDLFHFHYEDDGVHVYFNSNAKLEAEAEALRVKLRDVRNQIKAQEKNLVFMRQLLNTETELMTEISRREMLLKVPIKEYINTNEESWKAIDAPSDDKPSQLGLVRPWPSGRWLHNGCYRVVYIYFMEDNYEEFEYPIEFTKLSLCHMREGMEIVLRCSELVQECLRSIGFEIPMDNNANLRCFYVLGTEEKCFKDACVRICILYITDLEYLHHKQENSLSEIAPSSLKKCIIEVPLFFQEETLRLRQGQESLVPFCVSNTNEMPFIDKENLHHRTAGKAEKFKIVSM